MKNFKIGQALKARSVCDHNCIFSGAVVKRTAKTVTIITRGEEKRCKIHSNGEGEYIFPLGRYSMAPIFRA